MAVATLTTAATHAIYYYTTLGTETGYVALFNWFLYHPKRDFDDI